MKTRLLLMALPLVLLSVACAPGVGASNPALTQPGVVDSTQVGVSTSTPDVSRLEPGSRTAPVVSATPTPVSRTVITIPDPVFPVPTVVSAPSDSGLAAPSPTPVQVRPAPTATAVRVDPFATPTPLWIVPPTPIPTATSTPIPLSTPFVPPTVVAAAPGDQFESLLNHQFVLSSNNWSEVRTDSSVVLYSPNDRISMTITEGIIEPWRYPSALALGAELVPLPPALWTEWHLASEGPVRGENAYDFEYTGEKFGVPYRGLIRWLMWGDIHVQVLIEVTERDWEISSGLRNDVWDILDSFRPHDGTQMFTEDEVLAVLALRLDERPSGIYARDEVIRARVELTCDQLLTDLPFTLFHLGDGFWQLSVETLSGIESWRVYEPTGSILALSSNESKC